MVSDFRGSVGSCNLNCVRNKECLVSGSLRGILKFLSCEVLWMVGKGECDSVGFFVR